MPEKQVKKQSAKSRLEERFAEMVGELRLPNPTREHRFMETRKFRFDFAWEDLKIAIEIEGGTFMKGGHSRGAGYAQDCQKYNLAALHGWTVYRFTSPMLRRLKAGHEIEAMETLRMIFGLQEVPK